MDCRLSKPPALLAECQDEILEVSHCPSEQNHWRGKRWYWFALLAAFTFGMLLGLAHTGYRPRVRQMLGEASYSPATSSIEHSIQKLHIEDFDSSGVYWGPPSMEQLRAWEHLLQPLLFRTTRHELLRAGEKPDESIMLADGGYLASLSVYHDLHCLRRIRFWLYRHAFYPNITEDVTNFELGHVEHCLETLRTSIMCAADTSVYTFEWYGDDHKSRAKSAAQRMCAKWEGLDAWARDRAVGFKPIILRPT